MLGKKSLSGIERCQRTLLCPLNWEMSTGVGMKSGDQARLIEMLDRPCNFLCRACGHFRDQGCFLFFFSKAHLYSDRNNSFLILFIYLFIYFIFGCVGSSFLCEGFL